MLVKRPLLILLFFCLSSVYSFADDSLDRDFDLQVNDEVLTSALQADLKILIAGEFTSVGGVSQSKLARVRLGGSIDLDFRPTLVGEPTVVLEEPQGDILVAGAIDSVNGTARNNIARLTTNGTLDTSFNPNVSGSNFFGGQILAMALQPDGKVLIGGFFDTVNSTSRNTIARLNSNGSLDTGFNPIIVGDGIVGENVRAIALQDDGKILIGGSFASVGGVARNGIARLNSNGTLDTGFNPILDQGIIGALPNVRIIKIQEDNKIVFSGGFSNVNGVARNSLARLNGNGTLDTGFDVEANGTILTIVLQSDDKLLLGGIFSEVSGLPRKLLARVNSNGTLDTSFNANLDEGAVSTITQVTTSINVIGGSFNRVGGISRPYLARLIFQEDDELCVPIKTTTESLAVICL